ncbi:MAG: sialate O-acetylesterase [Planctomycetota bacterium]
MLILALILTDPAILSPGPWQVLQRTHESSATDVTAVTPSGKALVQLKLTGHDWSQRDTLTEYRLLPAKVPLSANTPDVPGNSAQQAAPVHASREWQVIPLQVVPSPNSNPASATASGQLTLPAGGWYRLEVRMRTANDGPAKVLSVEPIGVGEVFLIAGQSYATNTSDERLKVMDSRRRVSAYHWETGQWQPADDPQPAPDRSDGGSIWPPVGDRLAAALDVPIGFVNVAVGGTSVRQWSPDGPLSARLHRAGQSMGVFRAVLWQQGESDVIEGTSADDYVSRLQAIRAAAVQAWKFEPPWLCAQSTHHPTVYQNPDGEGRIREAIATVSRLPGFGSGPDTDVLTGPNRGGPGSRRHFSPLGQRNAAGLWSDLLLARFFASARSTP